MPFADWWWIVEPYQVVPEELPLASGQARPHHASRTQ